MSASADDGYSMPGQQTGFFNVSGTVSAPAPKTPPTLEGISNGQTINDVPVTVSGSCPSNTMVKVFKNEVLSGAALCSKDRRWTLPIDLFIGSNVVVARAFNTLEKSSADSNVVTVIYIVKNNGTIVNVSGPQLKPDSTPAGQFFIKAEVFHRGFRPGQSLWPLSIIGGTAPYAVSVAWGDKKTDVYSRGVSGPFDIKHTYEKSGSGYRGSQDVIIKASDANGVTTYLQLVSLVNDTGITSLAKNMPTGIQIAWPLLITAVLMIVCFLLGEWREKRILKKKLGAVPV